MSDEYQLRKDIDKIYFRVFDVENDQLAIYTKDEINEILKSNYYDISDIDIKFDSLIDLIYPIGVIYMTVNEDDPSVLFGGVWEQIEDTLANDSIYLWKRVE